MSLVERLPRDPGEPGAPRLDTRALRDGVAGGAFAALFFVGFLGWAGLARLDAGAYAHGQIEVSGNRQAVQNRDGGVVTALHVHDGQAVAQGQVLMEISAVEARANERSLASQYLSQVALKQRLLAERDGSAAVPWPAEFGGLKGDDLALAKAAHQLQQRELQARRQAIEAQHLVLGQQQRQLSQQIEGYNRQIAANVTQRQLTEDELKGLKSLAGQGFAPQTRVRAVEREAAELEGSRGSYAAEIAKSQEAIGQARMQGLSVDRDRMQEVAGQLRETQAKLDDVTPKLKAAREVLERAYVRAPASGQVMALSVFTVGGVVQPGQVLAQVVPTDKALVIEAQVPAAEAQDMKPGQTAQVRFPTLHERSLPVVQGTITSVSADSLTDEKAQKTYFKVEAKVSADVVAAVQRARGDRPGLRPGLPVDLIVPLRRRTALSYLLEPFSRTFWRSFREN